MMRPRWITSLLVLLAGNAIADGPYSGTHPLPGSKSPRIVQEQAEYKRMQIDVVQFSVPSDWMTKSAVVGVNFVSSSGSVTHILALNHANARPRSAEPEATIAQTLAHFCNAPFESNFEVLGSNSTKVTSLGYCKEVGPVESKSYSLFLEVRTPTHMLLLTRDSISDLLVAKSELKAVAESTRFQ
jgi:hypothetical protein